MPETPTDHHDLNALVRHWHQSGTPWVPTGLSSRVSWGAQLQGDPTHLSCRGLNRVIDHAIDDLTITVEAGLSLHDLQAILATQGQWLPVDWPRGTDPAQPESAGSVGGLVARGLAGGLRQRHLAVRDQIIGIGLLRVDGTSARAGGRVVKNVAGYDLMRLLCGSWGSLALITDITLRVQPIRPAHGCLHLSGPIAALETCRAELQRSTLTPERVDWHKEAHATTWQLRLMVSSVSDQAVADQLNRLETLARQHQLDAERHPCSNPLTIDLPVEPRHWLVRAVLPPATLHQLLTSTAITTLNGWAWELAAGAGCGDGWQPAATTASTSAQLTGLREQIEALGGSLMVLQQPSGVQQRLPAWTDSPARAVIQAVKQQFDPQHQLTPGRLPGIAG